MNIRYVIAMTLCAGSAIAQSYTLRFDTQYPDRPLQPLTFIEGATPQLDVYHRENGAKYTNLSDKTCVFIYGTNSTSSEGFVRVTNTTVNTTAGYYRIEIPANKTATNGVFWYTALVEKSGSQYYSGSGVLSISNSTATGSGSSLDLSTPINWSTVSPFLNPQAGPVQPGAGIIATTNAQGQVTYSVTVTAQTNTIEEVLAAGNDAAGLSITNAGDWDGTFDGIDGSSYLARANHTGTQTASTISDFGDAVSSNTLVSGALQNGDSNTNLVNDALFVTDAQVSTNALVAGAVQTETDPVHVAWLATNTYVKTEVDPDSLHLNGDNAMTGDLNMGGQSITGALNVVASTGILDAISMDGVLIDGHTQEGILNMQYDGLFKSVGIRFENNGESGWLVRSSDVFSMYNPESHNNIYLYDTGEIRNKFLTGGSFSVNYNNNENKLVIDRTNMTVSVDSDFSSKNIDNVATGTFTDITISNDLTVSGNTTYASTTSTNTQFALLLNGTNYQAYVVAGGTVTNLLPLLKD